MTLTTSEKQTLRDLLLAQLAQLKKAEAVGMAQKVRVYRRRIDALDKVLGNTPPAAQSEAERVTQRLQEGRY